MVFGKNPNDLRRHARIPAVLTATFLSTLAFTGCFGNGSSAARNFPALTKPVLGEGDKIIEVNISKAATLGATASKLAIHVNMDCQRSGHDETSVAIQGTDVDFSTYTCDTPQTDSVKLSPDSLLDKADQVIVQVNTSQPNLQWALSLAEQ